jgi:hypothetical protein
LPPQTAVAYFLKIAKIVYSVPLYWPSASTLMMMKVVSVMEMKISSMTTMMATNPNAGKVVKLMTTQTDTQCLKFSFLLCLPRMKLYLMTVALTMMVRTFQVIKIIMEFASKAKLYQLCAKDFEI